MDGSKLMEILPKSGLVYSERGSLSEVLCKPKIIPIKSSVLEKLEQIEQKLADTLCPPEEKSGR
jgi:BBSome-interacting protein 1